MAGQILDGGSDLSRAVVVAGGELGALLEKSLGEGTHLGVAWELTGWQQGDVHANKGVSVQRAVGQLQVVGDLGAYGGLAGVFGHMTADAGLAFDLGAAHFELLEGLLDGGAFGIGHAVAGATNEAKALDLIVVQRAVLRGMKDVVHRIGDGAAHDSVWRVDHLRVA